MRKCYRRGLAYTVFALIMTVSCLANASPAQITEAQVFVLRARKVVVGFEDGSMRWSDALSRAQAVKMIVTAMGLEGDVRGAFSVPVSFPDVSASHWAFRYINVAFEMGIARGFPDGTFRPDAQVTMAEYAVMLSRMYRALGGAVAEVTLQGTITPSWAAEEIRLSKDLVELLVLGTGESKSLDYKVARVEAGRLIYELMERYGLLFDIGGTVVSYDRSQGRLTIATGPAKFELRTTQATKYVQGRSQISPPQSLTGRQVFVILGDDRTCAFVAVE